MRPTRRSLESKLDDSLQKVDAQMAELNTQIGRINSDLRCDLQFNVYDRLDSLSLKVDAQRKETAEKFNDVYDRFDEHRKETLEKFAAVDTRFDKLEARFDKLEARFDKLEARFDKFEAEFYPRITEIVQAALTAVGFTYDPKLANYEQRISSLEWSRNCGRPTVYLSSIKFELMR